MNQTVCSWEDSDFVSFSFGNAVGTETSENASLNVANDHWLSTVDVGAHLNNKTL